MEENTDQKKENYVWKAMKWKYKSRITKNQVMLTLERLLTIAKSK